MFRAVSPELLAFSSSGWLLASFSTLASIGNGPSFWLVSPDGRYRRVLRLAPARALLGIVAFSPDGWRIAAVTRVRGDRALVIETLSGRHLRTLRRWKPSDPSAVGAIAWSRDNEISFIEFAPKPMPDGVCYSSPPSKLVVLPSSGGRPRVIATGANAMEFSPNGAAIAYIRSVPVPMTKARTAEVECPPPPVVVSHLYIATKLGARAHKVKGTVATDLSWSPRGTGLAFTGQTPGSSFPVGVTDTLTGLVNWFQAPSIFLVSRHGGTPRLLVSDASQPRWQP